MRDRYPIPNYGELHIGPDAICVQQATTHDLPDFVEKRPRCDKNDYVTVVRRLGIHRTENRPYMKRTRS